MIITWSFVYLQKAKSEAFTKILEFQNLIETQLFAKILKYQVNQGGEFNSKKFSDHCVKYSKEKIYAPTGKKDPHCSIIEWVNRTLLKKTHALLIQAGTLVVFWGEALLTVNFIHNRIFNYTLNISPYEK